MKWKKINRSSIFGLRRPKIKKLLKQNLDILSKSSNFISRVFQNSQKWKMFTSYGTGPSSSEGVRPPPRKLKFWLCTLLMQDPKLGYQPTHIGKFSVGWYSLIYTIKTFTCKISAHLVINRKMYGRLVKANMKTRFNKMARTALQKKDWVHLWFSQIDRYWQN